MRRMLWAMFVMTTMANVGWADGVQTPRLLKIPTPQAMPYAPIVSEVPKSFPPPPTNCPQGGCQMRTTASSTMPVMQQPMAQQSAMPQQSCGVRYSQPSCSSSQKKVHGGRHCSRRSCR